MNMTHFDPNKTYYGYGPSDEFSDGGGYRWVGKYTPDKKYTVFELYVSDPVIRGREVILPETSVRLYDTWFATALRGEIEHYRATTCRKKAFKWLEEGRVKSDDHR